jgi:hypothetical protein
VKQINFIAEEERGREKEKDETIIVLLFID